MRRTSLLLRTLTLGIALGAALGPGVARPDDLDDARKALRAGDRAAALVSIEKALAAKPGDQDARFLKGVALAEDGRVNEAMEVYQRLTQDFPELPEPYNNLAVLYAARGDFERARQSLDMAIRANPQYAVAQENLGDVYIQLAARAYERAAQLDPANRSAPRKLTLSREVVQRKPRAAPPAPAAASPAGASPVPPDQKP
jgi:Flp pilus assembly protein TadD